MLDGSYTLFPRSLHNFPIPSKPLDFAAFSLGLQAAQNDCFGRLGLIARLGGLAGPLDQVNQSIQGCLAVTFLRAVLPGFDDQHPLGGHSPACQSFQPLLDLGG